jgi:RNA polymerase sigma-70 factor, ECF subfamily
MQHVHRASRETSVHIVTTFEEFFEANRAQLFGALCLVTGDRSEAEELMQDAFLKVWERWDRIGELDRPDAYLFRAAMNLFRNRLRRARVAARKIVVGRRSIDDLALVEERDAVVRALRPLAPRQRAAVVLMTLMDYSAEEAARSLGIKPSTVRALATQGRAAARQALEEPS